MTKLTRLTQATFIPGRDINDNIFIAEVVHSLKQFKSNKCGMVLKIDLEKAYDRIRWDFLWDTLLEVGIPRQLVTVILHYVSSSSLQVLWNGISTDPFSSSSGITQGDLLSSYLFVLYMERLRYD